MRGAWVDAELIPLSGGTLLYLTGIQDDDSTVEVEILQDERPQWYSDARLQLGFKGSMQHRLSAVRIGDR